MLVFPSSWLYEYVGYGSLAPDIELLNRIVQLARFVRRLDESDGRQ